MEKRLIDLSCDLGEASTSDERIVEASLWPLISSANVACGGHTGDRISIADAARRAADHGVQLGAHPSYPDPEGFGRRSIDISAEVLLSSLKDQLDLIAEVAGSMGVPLVHVKPHGALYNDAHHDRSRAEILVQAIVESGVAGEVTAAPGSAFLEVATAAGLPVVPEAFADRRYMSDGSLQRRSEPGSLLEEIDDASNQAVRLSRDGTAVAVDGSVVPIPFRTLCIHGDMAGVFDRARAIRRALLDSGCSISFDARRLQS